MSLLRDDCETYTFWQTLSYDGNYTLCLDKTVFGEKAALSVVNWETGETTTIFAPAEGFDLTSQGYSVTIGNRMVTQLTPHSSQPDDYILYGWTGTPDGDPDPPPPPPDPDSGTFIDDDESTIEADIEWMAAAGITLGCNPEGTLYCPNDTVTRAQMASFLVRALDLPAAAGNRFTDVSGTHLANINALAEAGVTLGCNADGTLYCPNDSVSRAQMGSFLARALMLDPIPGDRFDDVSGTHESNINAIANAGITLGCNPEGTLYCPDDPVTRGQMAAFLHRALG